MLVSLVLLSIFLCASVADEDICESQLCILDADRLLNAATADPHVSACEDFKEFSIGSFHSLRALHDRYDRIGFLYDSLAAQSERQRKMLLRPIAADESFVLKVAKNFFQKCIDPEYIQHQGKQEAAEYLQNKGLPLIDGADWWPHKLNLTARLHDPAMFLDFFLAHRVTRCSDPRNATRQIICWKFSYEFDFLHKLIVQNPNNTRRDFKRRLDEIDFTLRVDEAIVNASIDHLLLFYEQLISIDSPPREKIPVICKISEISSYLTPYSREKLDWLYFVNQAFTKNSQAKSSEEEILIEDWIKFTHALNLLENMSPRIIGDVLTLGFLYGYEHMYILYPFDSIDTYKRGTKKDYQRFEQCLIKLETYFGPGMLSIYALTSVKSDTLAAAEAFVREAIEEVARELSEADDLEEHIKGDVVGKLKQITIVLGGLAPIYDETKMKEFYSEVGLEGNEKILKTTINMMRFSSKIDNEPKNSWKYQVQGLSHLSNLKYLPENDVINIPFEYLDFPYYHPNRSHFFNTATLFTEVVLSINEGIREYMKKTHGISYTLNYDSVQLGYKYYHKWLETNEERNLPGFSLTNNQMYWLAFANSYFMKYHSNVPFFQFEALNLQFEYFHTWFKFRPEFREAFNCSAPTEDEAKVFEILLEKFNKVYRIE